MSESGGAVALAFGGGPATPSRPALPTSAPGRAVPVILGSERCVYTDGSNDETKGSVPKRIERAKSINAELDELAA